MAKNKVPIYKIIADEITTRIYEGVYSLNSYLPSENELAEEFHVTRTTIRKVLEVLKHQGTIKSYPGKDTKFNHYYGSRVYLNFIVLVEA